jgi:hypothetical protein
MGRERCLFCDRFVFDGEDVIKPASLGLSVHRHCYLRDAGLESGGNPSHWETSQDSDADDDAA